MKGCKAENGDLRQKLKEKQNNGDKTRREKTEEREEKDLRRG